MNKARALRIQPALEIGFAVYAGDDFVAAFETIDQTCTWIEGQYRPERPGGHHVEDLETDLPRMLGSSANAQPSLAKRALQVVTGNR